MKHIFTIQIISLFLIFFPVKMYAQAPTVQDCLGAIPICQDFYYIDDPSPYLGNGNYFNEFNRYDACISPDTSGIWYVFTAQSSGDLRFTITPDIPYQDYDWTVFDITHANCQKLRDSTQKYVVSSNTYGGLVSSGYGLMRYLVRDNQIYTINGNDTSALFYTPGNDLWVSNYFDTIHLQKNIDDYKELYAYGQIRFMVDQTTGANSFYSNDTTGVCNGPGFNSGYKFNDDIPVIKGNTYIIYISNVHQGTGGFTFDLRQSSTILFDTEGPELAEITDVPVCGEKRLTVAFSKYVKCSSVSKSDFRIKRLGKTYDISAANNVGCLLGSEYIKDINMNTYERLDPGKYTLELIGEIEDACGNLSGGGSLEFYVGDIRIENVAVNNVTPCKGDKNGSMTVFTNSHERLLFSKDRGATYLNNGGFFENLPANTYYVMAKTGTGCVSNIEKVTITEPPELIIDEINYTPEIYCAGDKTGEITITAHGGTGALHYSIDGGHHFYKNKTTFTNLGPGLYITAVKDSKGCIKYGRLVNIDENPPVEIHVTYNDIATCYGDKNGSITIDASGGNPGYYYSVDGGETFYRTNYGEFENLPSGNYDIVVKDRRDCFAQDTTVTLNDPDPIVTEDIIYSDTILCHGGSSGWIDIQASGGTGDLSYSINDGKTYFENDGNFYNLSAGNYRIAIQDQNGCTIHPDTVVLNQPAPLIIDSVFFSPVNTCFGDSTGTISIFASGGTGNIIYSLDSSYTFTNNKGKFRNLSAGIYYPASRDVNGCTTFADSVIISQPSKVTIDTIDMIPPSCFAYSDGKIFFEASGGQGGYTYSIDTGATFQNDSGIFYDIPSKTYYLQAKDKKNCRSELDTISLSEPLPLNIDSIKISDITGCYGDTTGAVNIFISGGTLSYSYSLFGDSLLYSDNGHFKSLGSNNYVAEVKDFHGCTIASDSLFIDQPEKIKIDSTQLEHLTCYNSNNGEMEIWSQGGKGEHAYSLGEDYPFRQENHFMNLPAGKYPLIVRDTNQCVITADSIEIQSPPPIVFDIVTVNDVPTCIGDNTGSIVVEASGGTGEITFALNTLKDLPKEEFNKSGHFDSLLAGTYVIYARDQNQCTAQTDSLILTEPDSVRIKDITSYDPMCYGYSDGKISILAEGGANEFYYSVDNGLTFYKDSTNFDSLIAGSYTVVVKDIKNCFSKSRHIILSQPEQVIVSVKKTQDASCVGYSDGKVEFTASGGNSVSLYFSLDSGNTYQKNTFMYDSLSVGMYEILSKDTMGCTGQPVTFAIEEPPPIQIDSIIPEDVLNCHGDSTGSLRILASGGTGDLVYSIDSVFSRHYNSNIITGLPAETYTVFLKDENNCTKESSVVRITQPPEITFDSLEIINVSCKGLSNGKMRISGSGGTGILKYRIFNNEHQKDNYSGYFDSLKAGSYNIQVMDNNNCLLDKGPFVVSQPEKITIKLDELTHVNCHGDNNGKIDISVIAPGQEHVSFNWSNGSINEDLDSLSGGTYTIFVRDTMQNECAYTEYVVEEPKKLYATITKQDASCTWNEDGQIDLKLSGGVPDYEINVTDNLGHSIFNYNDLPADTYFISIRDSHGCALYDTVYINGDECQLEEFVVPNIFTPDGNGINERFQVKYSPDDIFYFEEFSGKIFTRWGRKIYEWEGEDGYWDGRINDSKRFAAPGIYFYIIQYKGKDGTQKIEKGYVHLMR